MSSWGCCSGSYAKRSDDSAEPREPACPDNGQSEGWRFNRAASRCYPGVSEEEPGKIPAVARKTILLRVKRSTLRLLSIAIGVLFTAAIYYSMHYRIPWDWESPGLGRLPVEVVNGFLDEAYERGQGADAVRDYLAPDILPASVAPHERANGEPIPHELRQVVAQGLVVVAFQRIGAARGEPATDAIDVFEVRDGRIVRRERYRTQFAQ